MLDGLLAGLPDLPDIWGEGGTFAFSGMDGPTYVRSGFVTTYAGQPFGLLIYTPRRRMLEVIVPEPPVTCLAAGDVYAASAPRGDLLVTFSAWHILVGIAPPGTALSLGFEDGPETEWRNPFWVTADPERRRVMTQGMGRGGRFTVAFGETVEEAAERARTRLACDVAAAAAARLAAYRALPHLESPQP
jgi:hypothetical protein